MSTGEKFVKFDDPSCGLNPFTPLECKGLKTLTKTKNIFRHIGKMFLLIMRVPCLFMTLLLYAFAHFMKFLFLAPILIRKIEQLTDWVMMKFFMNTASYNSIKMVYHKDDPKYDFQKWQKGELEVEHQPADVLICNQTSFVDWVFLCSWYSPIFTKIVVIKTPAGSKKVGLRVLSNWETLWNALGLVFPEERIEQRQPYTDVYFSLKKLRENCSWNPLIKSAR